MDQTQKFVLRSRGVSGPLLIAVAAWMGISEQDIPFLTEQGQVALEAVIAFVGVVRALLSRFRPDNARLTLLPKVRGSKAIDALLCFSIFSVLLFQLGCAGQGGAKAREINDKTFGLIDAWVANGICKVPFDVLHTVGDQAIGFTEGVGEGLNESVDESVSAEAE